jgi:hypothetical protein
MGCLIETVGRCSLWLLHMLNRPVCLQAMGTGGASRSPSGSPPDGAGSPGDRALLERMPSRPRANRASPMGPPLKLAAAVEAAAKGSSGEVLLGPTDRDVAGGRSSNASSMSGFQPYRSGSGTLKHSMSGSRLDGERV